MINDEKLVRARRDLVIGAIGSGEINFKELPLVLGILHVMENDGPLAEMVGKFGDQNRDKPEQLAIFDRASSWLLKNKDALKLSL